MSDKRQVIVVEPVQQPVHQEFPLSLEIPLSLGLLLGLGVSGLLSLSVRTEFNREIQDKNDLKKSQINHSSQNLGWAAEQKLIPNSQFPTPDSQIEFYNWDNIVKEAVGIIVAGNSGSAKTCLTTWLLGKLTQSNPAQVIILDPHANRNPLWEELGLATVSDFDLIEKQLVKLEELLDSRRNQPTNGDTVITVTEELGACIKKFSDPNRVQTTLERLGSEGRKYGLVLISVNTSANSFDIGISAQNRNNFVTILCRASARHFAENNWKKQDERQAWVRDTAYPTVVTGAVPGCVAVHPTHGHHQEFAILGKEPKGILPVNQKPLTIPLATDNKELDVSDNAKKLLAWFKTKTTGLDDSYSLRSIAQSKPLGKKESHKFEILTPLIEELRQAELIVETNSQNYRLVT